MKPAPFDYAKPSSIDEACRLLAEAGGGATVIAGGQTLMPLLNLRMSQPFLVVDLAAIEELQAVRHENGITSVSAMLRQNAALRDPTIAAHLPALAQALRHVGHHQTRNRGTIGGSIAFAEPAAECPATAVALGAQMRLRSMRGERRVAAREFFLGPYTTAMEPDELLVAIEFPYWPEGHKPVFGEVARRPGDFALVGFVGALVAEHGKVARAGLAWLGMGPTPIAATALERALVGQDIAGLDLDALAETALVGTAPFDDKAASAAYRNVVGRKLAARVLREALALEIAA